MSKRTVVSVSLNEQEMKMFNEIKETYFEYYYKDGFQYKNFSDFSNSDILKHLIHHEHYLMNMSKNDENEIL